MKRIYTVLYYKDNKPTVTKIKRSTLQPLLDGDAKGCFMKIKMNERMPTDMHNMIANHNKTTIDPDL